MIDFNLNDEDIFNKYAVIRHLVNTCINFFNKILNKYNKRN